MLLALYRAATRLGGPLIEAELRRRLRRGKEDPLRLAERLGQPGAARPAGPLLWLHGASIGESMAALPLAEALLATRPTLQVLITTGTVTSARLLAERLPPRARHQFAPVDRPAAWRSFLDHWRPQLAVLVESELWPNLILETRRRGVPLALVNARMSARSHRRWSRVPSTARQLLGSFDLCLARGAADRARFHALGAREVRAVGDLKYAALPPAADPLALGALSQAIGARPAWLAASTHPGEEEQVLEAHLRLRAHLPGLLTIIAPRHPERGAAVAALIEARGLDLARRSRDQLPTGACAVYLADTLGELGLMYCAARVAFIGKSLVPGGGQNPLEAARLGCPILLGPHTDNFAEIAQALDEVRGARRVSSAAELATAVLELLQHPEQASEMAERARRAVEDEGDVMQRTLKALAPLLDRTPGPADART